MKLYLNTISDLLWNSLNTIMNIEEFNDFRLVGGTSLSLQLSHRESTDIDLFTDVDYGSIDFNKLEKILIQTFPYVEAVFKGDVAMGTSFFIGNHEKDAVKLDLFYTDPFVFPPIQYDNIRLSSIEEITAMKLEVIAQGGRKKDFWDLHELLEKFTLDQMIHFYLKRYPYSLSKKELLARIIDFSEAEDDFLPNCYKDKDWENIKLDFIELIEK